jgi:hypothetical protein
VFAAEPQAKSARKKTARQDELFYLRKSTFSERVGETFAVHDERDIVEVVLAEVTDLAHAPERGIKPSPDKEGFALLFLGTGQVALGQGTYTMSHSELGTFPLFLVPTGESEKGRYFEAVINRMYP